jgi:hypothetical protein
MKKIPTLILIVVLLSSLFTLSINKDAKAFFGNVIFADAIQLDTEIVGWRLTDLDNHIICYKSLDNSPMVCMRITDEETAE